MIDLTREFPARTLTGRNAVLRFPESEHRARLARTRRLLAERGLDALLVFAQESHYYLTGFDTAGYVFFQVGLVTANDEHTVLLTRTTPVGVKQWSKKKSELTPEEQAAVEAAHQEKK